MKVDQQANYYFFQKLDSKNKELKFPIENIRMNHSSYRSRNHKSHKNFLKKKLNLTLHDFKITKILASGDQSNVYEAQSDHFQQKVVLKSFKLSYSNCQYDQFIERVQNQVNLNLTIQQSAKTLSNYFLEFYGYFHQHDTFFLIFELCTSNFRVFKKLKTYDQRYTLCLILLHDMIEALKILDRFKIIHRDIKPDNILFKKNGFKLADFGLGTFSFENDGNSDGIGNIFSKSPQAYAEILDTRSDIWSLGITVFYLLQDRLPFDIETIRMLSSQDTLQSYMKRIRNKKFSIYLKDTHTNKENYSQSFSIYSILHRILQVQVKQRPTADQIYEEFFKVSSFDESLYSKIIKQIIYPQKTLIKEKEGYLIKFLFLKYLQHRQDSLGIYFAIFLSCIKQISKINKKLLKFYQFNENSNLSQKQQLNHQANLLENVKISCIKLLGALYKIINEKNSQTFSNTNRITSFGKIQQIIEKNTIIIHQDQLKLEAFIKELLDISLQLLTPNEIHEDSSIEKFIEGKPSQKSVKFNKVLTCISQNNSKKQFQPVNFNEKSLSKNKSLKNLQSLQKSLSNQLPKSIKYINDKNKTMKVNQKEVLDNFQILYSKDNLNEKFPLLGQITQTLKKLIQTSEDSIKRKIFVEQEFKIWNLSLDLYKI